MSIVIDPKAGTHFTGKIFVTPHALDEATKDFGIERSKAPVFVMDNLRKASFVSMIVNEDGRPARLFGYKRMAFVVAPETDTVITVYPRHSVNQTLSAAVLKLLQRTLKSAERKEKTADKRTAIAKAELNVERASCELRKARSNSLTIIDAMNTRINEIDAELTRLDRELLEIKREKTNLANSLVVFI
ncbi:hypothetical protein GCM10008915_36580 [Bifidobacterium pullorum subsp. gallinarum]